MPMLDQMLDQKKASLSVKEAFRVPLVIPFSNSFYLNLKDIYGLKELLYNEGNADKEGLPLVNTDNRINSILPNSY